MIVESLETEMNVTLSNKTYLTLKWVVQIALPALGALYSGLAGFWGFPKALEVVGSLALIAAFLGVLLGVSSAGYRRMNEVDGGSLNQVGTDPETGMAHLALELTKLPDDLMTNDTVTFKVGPKPN